MRIRLCDFGVTDVSHTVKWTMVVDCGPTFSIQRQSMYVGKRSSVRVLEGDLRAHSWKRSFETSRSEGLVFFDPSRTWVLNVFSFMFITY